MKFLLAITLALAVIAPVAAKDKPLWAQDRTINAAFPLCAYNKGVFRIRPNGQGNYFLTCNDSTMIRVNITVERDTVAVASL